MSALWWLRVMLKHALARRLPVMEFCHRCGADVGVIWRVKDYWWARVVPGRWSILCPRCFSDLAEDALPELVVRWLPVMEPRDG